MSEEQSKINLPTELINEKTFYTLGGASAGVLLVCWVINYVTVDVSWLNYKSYRIIGLVLSEAFAIVIMLNKKEKKSMKWLFAVLNGFLIFVNASGLNVMTSSYIFNPSDTARKGAYNDNHFHQIQVRTTQHAGIFTLPRMVSWWPDEQLIQENKELITRNDLLTDENKKLKTLVDVTSGNQPAIQKMATENDSLQQELTNLKSQVEEKQKQLDVAISNMNTQDNNLKKQLTDCLQQRNSLKDSLQTCLTRYNSFNERYEKLRNTLEGCNKEKQSLKTQLTDCLNQKDALTATINSLNEQIKNLNARTNTISLTEHIKQACNQRAIRYRPGYVKTSDDYLKEQAFWKTFCNSFNSWITPIQ